MKSGRVFSQTAFVPHSLYVLTVVPARDGIEPVERRRQRAQRRHGMCAHLMRSRATVRKIVGIATGPAGDPVGGCKEIVAFIIVTESLTALQNGPARGPILASAKGVG